MSKTRGIVRRDLVDGTRLCQNQIRQDIAKPPRVGALAASVLESVLLCGSRKMTPRMGIVNRAIVEILATRPREDGPPHWVQVSTWNFQKCEALREALDSIPRGWPGDIDEEPNEGDGYHVRDFTSNLWCVELATLPRPELMNKQYRSMLNSLSALENSQVRVLFWWE